jgi:hypothetical protein
MMKTVTYAVLRTLSFAPAAPSIAPSPEPVPDLQSFAAIWRKRNRGATNRDSDFPNIARPSLSVVMAGLEPAIHAQAALPPWMAGPSPAMTMEWQA